MNTFRSLARFVLHLAVAAALLAPAQALAGSHVISSLAAAEAEALGNGDVVLAQAGDCYAIGERVAAENGGTLARASASTQGGREVCIVVVLVPAKDGKRPRRTEIVVPLN